MAATPALLTTAHASGLNAVERELSALHRAMLRTGDDESRAVRLSVLNLVVAGIDQADTDRAAEAVEWISGRHPARAIIVHGDRAADPVIEADLSLQCSLVAGREQVCVELVRLHVGGESALHLSSVVGPLLLSDVPVYLWLAGPVPLGQALSPEVVSMCERIILDSGAHRDPRSTLAEIGTAVEHSSLPVCDLAWTRTLRCREAVAEAFDSRSLAPFVRGITEAEMVSAGDAANAEALLFGGWLVSRLEQAGHHVPRIVLSSTGNAATPGWLRSARLTCRDGTRTATVELSCDESRLSVRTSIDGVSEDGVSLPIEVPPLGDLIGALLAESGIDPLYVAALGRASRLT